MGIPAQSRSEEERARDLEKAKEAIRQGRQFLTIEFPYFEMILTMLRPVWDPPGLPTLAVDDGARLFMNSQFCAGLDGNEAAAVLAHEANHIMRDHGDRRGDRDPEIWNIACDAAINFDLRNSTVPELPGDPIFPETINCEAPDTEEHFYHQIYEEMMKKRQEQQQCPVCGSSDSDEDDQGSGGQSQQDQQDTKGQQGQQDQGGGSGQQDQSGSGSQAGQQDQAGGDQGDQAGGGSGQDDQQKQGQSAGGDQGDQQGQGQQDQGGGSGQQDQAGGGSQTGQQGQSGSGPCPACGGGEERGLGTGQCGAAARGAADRNTAGWDATAESQGQGRVPKSEIDTMVEDTARAVIEADSRRPGSVPADLLRACEEKLTTKVDWQSALYNLTYESFNRARDGLSARRLGKIGPRQQPVRHGGGATPIYPGVVHFQPEVTMVIDTSGSMSERHLGQAMAEACGIIEDCLEEAEVALLACDAAADATQYVNRAEQIELRGGGGTDMGAGLATAYEATPDANTVIVLTDGYTPWPDDPPPAGMDVIVGIIHEPRQTDVDRLMSEVPSWAQKIAIDAGTVRKRGRK